jgi:hypothetical protein
VIRAARASHAAAGYGFGRRPECGSGHIGCWAACMAPSQPGQRVLTRGEATPSSVRTRRIADQIEQEPSPSNGALGHAAGGAPEPWQSQQPSRASRDTPTKSRTTRRSAGSSGGNSTGSMPTNLSVALDAEASRRHFQTAPKRTARRLDPVIGSGWELGRKVRLPDIEGSNAGSRKLRSAWGLG